METENLNKSICEEVEGDLDVVEELDPYRISDTRFGKLKFVEGFDQLKECVKDLESTINRMEEFSDSKKNMFLLIRQGI